MNKPFRLNYVDTSYFKITTSHVWTLSKYYGHQNSIEIYLFTFFIVSYYEIQEVFNFGKWKWEHISFPSLPPGNENRWKKGKALLLFFFSFTFISWRLITLQYCSGFCHTLTWISHGFTCIPHPYPPSHLPLHPIPLDLPSAPGPSTCLMHPTWAGDLFHPR